MLPKSSSAASTPCGTRHVASYSCTISGPARGVARPVRVRSTTGVSTQPMSGNQARSAGGHRDRRGWNGIRQPRPLGQAARDDRDTHQFHRFIRRRAKAIVAFVLLRRTVRQSAAGNPLIGQPHLDLARLPDVARLGGTPELLPLGREAIARQPLRAGGRKFGQHRRDPRTIGLIDRACAGCASRGARYRRPAVRRR